MMGSGSPALLLIVTLVPTLISALSFSDFSDLPPGPYCATSRCCTGRLDRCAVQIIGTLCYCDEFCNRTRSADCCPDYYTHCLGLPPPDTSIKPCHYKGRDINYKQKVKDNCNVCECTGDAKNIEMVCESDPCMIEQHLVDSVNRDERVIGWHASNYTEFWGKKLADGLTFKLGTLQPNRSVLNMEPVKKVYVPSSLPKYFDAEQKWPGQLSGIDDQGWCGSSWAISTTAVASDRYSIMSKKEEQVMLSPQNLLSCDNRGQKSCHGGYLDRAWLYLRKYGVVTKECYPYEGKPMKCRIPKNRKSKLTDHCSPPENPLRKTFYKMSPAYKLGNETDIMFEILENGPVQATMKVYQDFFSYRGGIYKHSALSVLHSSGYHSVRIVGWGEDTSMYPPKKYWKVANSWGQEWGEDGYFRILKGSNECDIENFVIAAWAKTVDSSGNEVLATRNFVNRRRWRN